MPHLHYNFTVNQSIADIFKSNYNANFQVLRNVPLAENFKTKSSTMKELGLPEDKFIVLMQGCGINIFRGAEELLMSATHLSEEYLILFIGSGDVFGKLKTMAAAPEHRNKVEIMDKMPYKQLIQYTKAVNLSATLDHANNLNYRFSLPNKLFDYIHAGLPVLASDLVEVKRVIKQYEIGNIVPEVKPEAIANAIMHYKTNTAIYLQHKKNTKKAALELCWESEKFFLKMLALLR